MTTYFGIEVREAKEVVAIARGIRGMFAFFALIGVAISHGRSKVAFMMLTAVGVERRLAWLLIDGWEQMVERETTTGWTPEVAAMGFVMGAVDRWRKVQWLELIGQFVTSANPDGAAL